MIWQKRLRNSPMSSHMSIWKRFILCFAIFINIIVACFYPFGNQLPNMGPHTSGIVWSIMLVMMAVVVTFPCFNTVIALVLSCILKMVMSFGPQISLSIMGLAIVIFQAIHLISIMVNRDIPHGNTINIFNFKMVYELLYRIFSITGLIMHPFFFAILMLDVLQEALLALILMYMFSIWGFLFFLDDFIIETSTPPKVSTSVDSCRVEDLNCPDVEPDLEPTKERSCDTLLMCIVTVFNHSLRNGGGIGDILRQPSSTISFPHPNALRYDVLLCRHHYCT